MLLVHTSFSCQTNNVPSLMISCFFDLCNCSIKSLQNLQKITFFFFLNFETLWLLCLPKKLKVKNIKSILGTTFHLNKTQLCLMEKSTLKWSTDMHHKQENKIEFKSHNIDGAMITDINLTVISHLILSFGVQIPSLLIAQINK